MDSHARDRMLLAILEPDDRAKIEEVVDEIIEEEISILDADRLRDAAAAFERRGETLPDDRKLVAWQIAAALRSRVPGLLSIVN